MLLTSMLNGIVWCYTTITVPYCVWASYSYMRFLGFIPVHLAQFSLRFFSPLSIFFHFFHEPVWMDLPLVRWINCAQLKREQKKMQFYLFDTQVTMSLGQHFTRENVVITGLSKTPIAKDYEPQGKHFTNFLYCIIIIIIKGKIKLKIKSEWGWGGIKPREKNWWWGGGD